MDDLRSLGSVKDIAVTVLALLRIPVGLDMEGRVLTELIADTFDIDNQPNPVDTHDTEEFRANRPKFEPRAARDRERRRQLRALGYIQ
jgi:hypothetical protein